MENIHEPIRVAHIMGKMMSGGVESMVMNYYRHMDRTKVQFDFIIDEDSTVVPYEEIEGLGGKVYRIPPYQKVIPYHKALVELFRQNRYRIVHSHINTLSVFPLLAAKRASVPVRIAHSHSTAGKGELVKNILKYMLRPFAKVFPTHYCACSEYAGRWLFGDRLVDTGRVRIVRNAIDLSKFAFNADVREAVREGLNIADKLVIGHVGRFMKQKNHAFLVDIFEAVHQKEPNSVLLLVGEGELEEEIRAKVDRLGLTEAVQFLGVRNDVHRLLQGMDVFLLPSLYEGLGMVAVEAQATSLKTICSDAVPAEAKITEDFIYMPLSAPTGAWAKKVLTCISNRKSGMKQILYANYKIQEAANYLNEWYNGIYPI